jgi:hypothetical protein
MKKFITYTNIKKIFICNGKKYINKCFKIQISDIPKNLLVKL